MRPALRPLLVLLVLALAPPASGDERQVRIVGSETLAPLVSTWAKELMAARTGVFYNVRTQGSSTGPPALLSGEADVAALSRPLRRDEAQAFRIRRGSEPLVFEVAADAITLVVNATNPLQRLSLRQIDAVFSSGRRCGAPAPIRTWGELGLGGAWAERTIHLFSRQAGSGTRSEFKRLALCDGEVAPWAHLRPGPGSLAFSVAESRSGIGYGSLGDRLGNLKRLAVAKQEGGPWVAPEPAAVLDGSYPLARRLRLVLAAEPDAPLRPAVRRLLEHALSPAGQVSAESLGFLPLPVAELEVARRRLR